MSEEEVVEKWRENPMLKPRIEKVTVNISVGRSGDPLERASRVLKELTGQTPCKRKAKKTIRDFGIRKGEPIACVVTLRKEKAVEFLEKALERKEKAVEFLEKALEAVDKKLSKRCFDKLGNFSFGIKEHIEIPGTKYVPELGIYGMDVCVALERPGYRVKRRRRAKSKIGSRHLIKPEEAMLFVKETFGVEIT